MYKLQGPRRLPKSHIMCVIRDHPPRPEDIMGRSHLQVSKGTGISRDYANQFNSIFSALLIFIRFKSLGRDPNFAINKIRQFISKTVHYQVFLKSKLALYANTPSGAAMDADSTLRTLCSPKQKIKMLDHLVDSLHTTGSESSLDIIRILDVVLEAFSLIYSRKEGAKILKQIADTRDDLAASLK
ncbi:MAG: hypothetical protein ABII22_02255 [Candidatus Micrarchaeota archaeon]